MSSIKVIDINEEAKQEEPVEQPIEEAKEEIKEEVNEVVEEPAIEQESKTEQVEEVCKEVKKPIKTQDKLVRCAKCNREMKLKSYRYGHQQKCKGGIENTPVKPFSKPRATPKTKPQSIVEEVEEIVQHKPKQTQPVSNQILKPQPRSAGLPDGNLPSNPLVDITNHYQLLQNEYLKQKQAKYNNLCQNMFAPKSKKMI